MAAVIPACLPVAAWAQLDSSQPSAKAPSLTCEHANGPPDTYVGWVDKQTGVFLFRCLLFADRSGVAFQMSYRSPRASDDQPAGVIGGGWGTDFDDRARPDDARPDDARPDDARPDNGRRVIIRNGADGSVDTYAARRRGSPLLISGKSADQRARRAQTCDYVEHETIGGLRRVDCGRNIQHFDDSGRLIRYSTHASRQIFELNWGDGSVPTVTLERPLLVVLGASPAGETIYTAFRRQRDGRLVVIDQDDRRVTMVYDPAGSLTRVQSSAGEAYSFSYAADGTLVEVGFPGGRTQKMTYDAKGRIALIEGSGGGSARFLYHRNETEVIERAADGASGRTVVTFK